MTSSCGVVTAVLLACAASASAPVPDAVTLTPVLEYFKRISQNELFMPLLVRLAFHDCVGGCNGCLNMRDPENRGLEVILREIDRTFDRRFKELLSRADYYALGGHVAVQRAAGNAGTLQLLEVKVLMGREDCDGSPRSEGLDGLPNAAGDLGEYHRVFVEGLNMTLEQALGLVGGAHSLGKLHPRSSGFTGQWTQTPMALDNSFWQELADPANKWEQFHMGTGRWQFLRDINQLPAYDALMLPTDISMLRDLGHIDPQSGQAHCSLANDCPEATTADLVRRLAASNGAAMRLFSEGWMKMITAGQPEQRLTPLLLDDDEWISRTSDKTEL